MKKVLIITYYWPPAGGPGVQRWLKFVKYLPDFNVHPIVFIPENPTYPLLDDELVQDVSNKTTIITQKIIEPYAGAALFSKKNTQKISAGIMPKAQQQSILQKIMLWVRGNLFIPDARVLWVKPATKKLQKYINEHQITTIITTGPPHSVHLIGLALKEKNTINWIADFRDPWTTIGYHNALKLSNWAKKKHQQLEQKVVNNADKIIVTSPTTKVEFEAITQKPIVVITNGYDEETINDVQLDTQFTLAHIGSLLSDRNPIVLWQSLSEILNENLDFSKDFELKLIGAVSDEVLNSIHQFGLDVYLNNLGYVSHQKALEAQKSTQVLLLIEIDAAHTRCIIPGKVFEYIKSGRPILAIGPENADFSKIIQRTETGIFALYSEKEKIKNTILDYYKSYKKGQLFANGKNIEQYSRKNLTQELVNYL